MKCIYTPKTLYGLILGLVILFLFSCAPSKFHSQWPEDVQRIWIGPEYWANRLQDWRISNGRLECIFNGENRNVHILTRQLEEKKGDLDMRVRLGLLDNRNAGSGKAWAGFCIGARGEFDDYRDSSIYGKGLDVGITARGELFIGTFKPGLGEENEALLQSFLHEGIELRLEARAQGRDYRLELSAHGLKTGRLLARVCGENISNKDLTGNLALVSHLPETKKPDGKASIWFSDWMISGSKVEAYEDRAFGPILFSMYTLSKDILKITAQMPPVSQRDGQTVDIQVLKNGAWTTIEKATIDKLARTATLRVEGWDGRQDVPYRLVYDLLGPGGKMKKYYWQGTIRKEPVEKEEIIVAAFTGNNDLGFPHKELVRHVRFHNPDVMFFSGDQIYEPVGGYGVQRSPLDMSCLDYLRKWYIFGWSYRELLCDRPTVAIPDDHDVYHGNIWGCGGKPAQKQGSGAAQQDSGGYRMPPDWVNMVQRTQTSHLPEPFDSTPVKQEIGVYYCEMNYGGVSFAVLEDRKFKSAPKALLPEADVWNGWPRNREFNAEEDADLLEAKLLGERQVRFLHHWAADWSHGTWMKVVLSQTLLANVATLPVDALTGSVIPSLRILHPGEYPEGERCVTDMDSNGWPQTGRNEALREIRRGFALHICGDQHLGSTIHYGVEDWNDAGFALCVPSVSNYWPRRWYPPQPGRNRLPGSPKYTGEFKDGFGNKITVYAVSNPVFTKREPSRLHDRAPGYGIVRLNRENREITIECWPRGEDPSSPNAKQYPGWPVQVNQLDNYGRRAYAYLPRIEVSGMRDPVIQVIDEAEGDIVYTLRIKGASFRPKVFKEGSYTVKVEDPDTGKMKVLQTILPLSHKVEKTIKVEF